MIQKIVLLLSLVLLFSNTRAGEKNSLRPNVILIISDDHGYADYGAFNGKHDVRTPHLDKLANSGVRFTNAYVTMAICSPSRLAIMTGRQQQRWGVYNYAAKFPESEVTLAEQLKEKGYSTGMVGKTHYGMYTGPGAHEFPTDHGFEYFFGKEGGTMDYLRHKQEHFDIYTDKMAKHLGVGPFWENDKKVEAEGYSTDIILDKSLAYIDAHIKDPFFLTVSFNAVHLFTHQIPETDLEAMGIPEVPEWDPKEGTWDEYLHWYVATVYPETPQGRQRYLYHLHKMDDAVGALMDKLKTEGLYENTIVVFVSDNGGSPNTYADNWPLRGNKYILEEGGIRVPFVISWPGNLEGGKVLDETVVATDIFPTIHAALGIDLPANREIDGVDLLPYIKDKKTNTRAHEWLFWTGFSLKGKPLKEPDHPMTPRQRINSNMGGEQSGWAARYRDWKLRYYGNSDRYGLYDLSVDYSERNNLVSEHPELKEKMEKNFFEWHAKMKKEAESME